MSFASDTAAPVHPLIMEAIASANVGGAPSYGADPWMRQAQEALEQVFETELAFWPVVSGTAANALGLALLCPSVGGVLCHREAHVERDERGAPEFFTGGGKLCLLDGPHGKIDALSLKRRLAANQPAFVHETPLHVLSFSNLTEAGTAYSAAEMAELATQAQAAGLHIHLDGARFANALVSSGASPPDLSWRAGVDVMSFGATKNGALACEGILLFGETRKRFEELRARAKRAGHMPPKLRYTAAQISAYLRDGLWLELARRANLSARRLGQVLVEAGAVLVHPIDGNEVFAHLPEGAAGRLSSEGLGFYPWADGSHRFVCAWSTTDDEIARVEKALVSV